MNIPFEDTIKITTWQKEITCLLQFPTMNMFQGGDIKEEKGLKILQKNLSILKFCA